MSKYKESPISAAVYQRSPKITIINPYEGNPSVIFEEEQIIKRPDGSVIHDTNFKINSASGMPIPVGLHKQITDLNETYRLYDPISQTRVGQDISIANVYAIIWSIYMEEALKRDAKAAKEDVLYTWNKIDLEAKTQLETDVAAVYEAFRAQDVLDAKDAKDLQATKETQEEKDAVWADYQAAKQVKSNAAVAEEQALRATYQTFYLDGKAQADLDAQAAYDAIWNG